MSDKPIPTATPVTAPHWAAADQRRLSVQRCDACGEHVFYPRLCCPFCGSCDLTWVDCSGRATLDSYIINHAPAPGFDDPHIIAIISLEEGPRMATSIVGVPPDPAVLKLDMPLQVDFETRGEHLVPVFRPIGA